MEHDRAMATTLGPPATPGNDRVAMNVAMLLIRLAMGTIFFVAGAKWCLGWFGGPGTAPILGAHHAIIVRQSAWRHVVHLWELVGGACVLVGLFSRISVAGFLVLLWTSLHNHAVLSGVFASRDSLMLSLIALAAAVLLCGPGLISLDAWFFRRGLWSRGPQPLGSPAAADGAEQPIRPAGAAEAAQSVSISPPLPRPAVVRK